LAEIKHAHGRQTGRTVPSIVRFVVDRLDRKAAEADFQRLSKEGATDA
jgi:hypothetical protein